MSRAAKKCSRCGVTKPIDAFNRDRTNRDGRRYECRDCTRREQTRNRGGYVSPARGFVENVRSTLDPFALIDAAIGRTPPPKRETAPADLAVGRVIAVTDSLLVGLLTGDQAARLEALRKLETGR